MAWLEAHRELVDHPKTAHLAELMRWNKYETVGRLFAFWSWGLSYATTGDLRKFNDAQIGASVALNGDDARRFVEALVESCWIDRFPGVFRIHEWPEYVGRYLRESRFKHKPERLKEVEDLYALECPRIVQGNPELPTVPTNRTNPERESLRAGACFPSLEDVRACGVMIGCPPLECESFWNHFESVGWVNKHDQPITNWRSKLAVWKTEAAARKARRPSGNGQFGLSIMDMKSIIQAKETKATEIKNRHCSQVAMGEEWSDAKARTEYRQLRREIRELNDKIANLA